MLPQHRNLRRTFRTSMARATTLRLSKRERVQKLPALLRGRATLLDGSPNATKVLAIVASYVVRNKAAVQPLYERICS